MKNPVILATLAVSLASAAHAQNIAGDWQGTLKAGEAELRLVLHLTKGTDGSLSATLDSVDQGANGIPVSSVSFKDSKLNLTVDAVKGTYEGTVNADATAISGTWTQGQPLPLDFHRGAAAVKTEHKPGKPSDIDGDWQGALDLGTAKLRLAFHITNTEDGLTATMDSLDQNIKGMPVTAVTRDGASIKMELKSIGGRFEGKISKDLAAIEGAWIQNGNSLPLVLKRVKSAAELERRRPQNPVKPYPYREEEVAYHNKAAGIQLAATLTTPTGTGPFPAVLLICGSGPHDRDESLQGHRPFLVLADYLTRKGIAVLRADKRGVGQSTGDDESATMTDFATDAEAGVAYLKTRAEVDAHRIGLVGHSEGAMVAPMVATHNSDVAFLVLMAGPGVPGDQILAVQKAFDLKIRGMKCRGNRSRARRGSRCLRHDQKRDRRPRHAREKAAREAYGRDAGKSDGLPNEVHDVALVPPVHRIRSGAGADQGDRARPRHRRRKGYASDARTEPAAHPKGPRRQQEL